MAQSVYSGIARLVAVVALIAAGVALPSRAEEPASGMTAATGSAKAQRLDELFARLRDTKDEIEGEAIVEEIWRVWLQSGRSEIDSLLRTALADMETGNTQKALAAFDDIVLRAPEWAEGWNKRATLLYMLDDYDRSLADIDRVLALEPRHFGALAGRGLIHIAREDYRAALHDYRQALAFNPFLKGGANLLPALERRAGERPL